MEESERPAQRIMNSLKELDDFLKGRGGPLTLYMPDGNDGLEARVVNNIDEYRDALKQEFRRVARPGGGIGS